MKINFGIENIIKIPKILIKFWKSLYSYEKWIFGIYFGAWIIFIIGKGLEFYFSYTKIDLNNYYNAISYLIVAVIGWNVFTKTKEFEEQLLKNFSRVIFIIILFFTITPANYVNIQKTTFYIIGGLFAFWYGYKKYERDKELEIIEKYGKRYDDLKNNNDYSGLLSLFEEEFYLYKKGYISKDLWRRIKHKIDKNLLQVIEKIIGEINGIEDYNKPSKYIPIFANDDLMCHWKGFGEYVINRLKEIQQDNEKIVSGKVKGHVYQNKDVVHNSKEIIATIKLLIPNIEEIILANKKHFNN